jgi:hypothetical protein
MKAFINSILQQICHLCAIFAGWLVEQFRLISTGATALLLQDQTMPTRAQSQNQDYADAARHPSSSNLQLRTSFGVPLPFGVALLN